jgi:hypothetical protein
MSYLDMALRAKKEESIQEKPHMFIDQTLREINGIWEPETLAKLKERPGDWQRMLTLESEINRIALQGNVDGLKKALGNYKRLFLNH